MPAVTMERMGVESSIAPRQDVRVSEKGGAGRRPGVISDLTHAPCFPLLFLQTPPSQAASS